MSYKFKTKLFGILHQAIQSASFESDDVEKEVNQLLTVADGDLDAAGFEESETIEEQIDSLNESIKEYEAENTTSDDEEEEGEIDIPDDDFEEEDEEG